MANTQKAAKQISIALHPLSEGSDAAKAVQRIVAEGGDLSEGAALAAERLARRTNDTKPVIGGGDDNLIPLRVTPDATDNNKLSFEILGNEPVLLKGTDADKLTLHPEFLQRLRDAKLAGKPSFNLFGKAATDSAQQGGPPAGGYSKETLQQMFHATPQESQGLLPAQWQAFFNTPTPSPWSKGARNLLGAALGEGDAWNWSKNFHNYANETPSWFGTRWAAGSTEGLRKSMPLLTTGGLATTGYVMKENARMEREKEDSKKNSEIIKDEFLGQSIVSKLTSDPEFMTTPYSEASHKSSLTSKALSRLTEPNRVIKDVLDEAIPRDRRISILDQPASSVIKSVKEKYSAYWAKSGGKFKTGKFLHGGTGPQEEIPIDKDFFEESPKGGIFPYPKIMGGDGKVGLRDKDGRRWLPVIIDLGKDYQDKHAENVKAAKEKDNKTKPAAPKPDKPRTMEEMFAEAEKDPPAERWHWAYREVGPDAKVGSKGLMLKKPDLIEKDEK
jgi:hypothetical protein